MARWIGGALSVAACVLILSDPCRAQRETRDVDLGFEDGKLTSITIEKEVVTEREPGEELKKLIGIELGGSFAIDGNAFSAGVAVPMYFSQEPFPTGEGEAKGFRFRPAISFMSYKYDFGFTSIEADMMFWEVTAAYFKTKFKEKEGKILGTGFFVGAGLFGYEVDSGVSGMDGIQFNIAAGGDIFMFNPGAEQYSKITVTVGFSTSLELGGTFTYFF